MVMMVRNHGLRGDLMGAEPVRRKYFSLAVPGSARNVMCHKPPMSVAESRPGKKAIVSAVTAVAATYVYFLLFAQFGFLQALQVATGGAAGVMKPVLGVMGLAGIAGSVLAAKLFSPARARSQLVAGFAVCAAAAGLCLLGGSLSLHYGVAVLVGTGTGLITVTLAGLLRRALGGARLGTFVGLGTGLAYAFCNWPAVFNAAPAVQAVISLVICGLGALAAAGLELGAEAEPPAGFDYSRQGVALWVLVFFTLVGLDSAAFYIIQHTPEIKDETWSGAWRLEVNAGMHLVAAVLAGYALDRRRIGRVVLVAGGLLVMACVLMDGSRRSLAEAALSYTAGVSVYSAALVFYPARSQRPGLAALVFAVAGWLGSALGIGLAENRHVVPVWLVVVGGGVIFLAMLGRRFLGAHWTAILLAGFLVMGGGAGAPRVEAQETALIDRGRAVFIGEGCIHCHSQYVRPGTGDGERGGPVQPLAVALAQQPPLLGNRRQGPDLQNVGNRRNAEWNRLHLIAPRLITPGSRMPSYAHLFAAGSSEGGPLLAYLDSLGEDTTTERWAIRGSWAPVMGSVVFSPGEQQRLFGQWCAACHGADARGDGPVAALLTSAKPRNLVADGWRYIPAGATPAAEQRELARLIKFGVPGTAMAGREYLDDDTVLSLAAYLQTLRAQK
jgi:cytochrome c oxidase cbb3-type subunit 2